MFPLASSGTHKKTRGARAGEASALVERAPALRDHAERLMVALVKGLQTMAGTTTVVEGVLAGIKPAALRDVLAAHRASSVAATIDCAGLPCTLLVTLDAVLVHGLVELLCGGNGSEPMPAAARKSTAIDALYAQIVASLVAAAIAADWAELGFGATKVSLIEGTPASDVCGARVEDVWIASLALTLFGQRGLLSLALPPAAVDAFAASEANEPEGLPLSDGLWSSALNHQIGRTPLQVDVLLDARPLSLRTIAALKPGQVLELSADARTRASLVCNGRTLYRGEIGQDDDRYSLRVDEIVLPAQSPSSAGRSPKPFLAAENR